MADEGEVDVLGDFDFKLEAESEIYDANELPSKSANLLPEYTNPPWMLEQGWPMDNYMDEKSKATIEKMLLEEQFYINGRVSGRGKGRLSLAASLTKGSSPGKSLLGQTATNKADQKRLAWTEDEKDMFHKGMEIYGRSWTKIAELIPSRTSVQIKNFAHQLFKQQKKESSPHIAAPPPEASPKAPTEDKMADPVAETIATVSTATTTVTVRHPILPRKGRIPKLEKAPGGFNRKTNKNSSSSASLLKQRSIVKLKGRSQKLKKLNHFKGKHKLGVCLESDKSSDVQALNSLNLSKDKASSIVHGLLDHKMKITPDLIENLDGFCAVADIIAGGDNDEEEDDDIDIENDDDLDVNPVLQCRSTSPNSVYKKLLLEANLKTQENMNCQTVDQVGGSEENNEVIVKGEEVSPDKAAAEHSTDAVSSDDALSVKVENVAEDEAVSNTHDVKNTEDDKEVKIKTEELPKMIINAVMTCDGEIIHFPVPTSEVTMGTSVISDDEKLVHKEFFDNRPSSKTPERYLKIRNYILDSWRKCRPNYLNKTSVRPGLKNCGDVNCIGRVHAYLECIGAINFGCEQALYNHPRPMLPFYHKERNVKDVNTEANPAKLEAMRPRKRKVRDAFGVWIDEKELEGKTIEHNGKKTSLDKDGKPRQQKLGYDPFKLIPCLSFDQEKQEPFHVCVHTSALIVMDIHSHVCKTEVIGMLGGKFCPAPVPTLTVTMATPCNSISTGMQCEMDPVSQTQASEEILGSGMDVVGWYHSHPSFAPNPSVRDIETQLKFQDWFSKGGSNFVGMIVSPYNPRNPSLCSEINCLTVSDEILPLINCNIPYRFAYSSVACEVSEINNIILTAQDLATSYTSNKHRVNLASTYSAVRNISCLDKMLESLKSHYPVEQDSVGLLDSIRKAFHTPPNSRAGDSPPNSHAGDSPPNTRASNSPLMDSVELTPLDNQVEEDPILDTLILNQDPELGDSSNEGPYSSSNSIGESS